MSNPPFYFDYVNVVDGGYTPSTVHIHDSKIARFFRKYLVQRAMAFYKWTMPETWDENYVLYCLYDFGFFGVINTDLFGVIPQQCTLSGRGIMYQPTHFIVSNPLLPNAEPVQIGVNGVLVRLQPNYSGISDLVSYYADMMSLVWETAAVNIMNSKLSYVFFPENQTQAEALKKIYDNLSSGNPAAFIGKRQGRNPATDESVWQPFAQNVGANYIAGDLLVDLRKIEQMFLNEIGYHTANTEKKERLLTSEVNVNSAETLGRAEMWLEFLQKQCREARDMFGIELDVDWRYPPERGLVTNGNPDSQGPVSVGQ